MAVGHQVWAAEQSANTRRELILVAMRLMAEKGVEGVSLRSVNLAAGAKNSSAAHYHFGSKTVLVQAIVELLAEAHARWREPLIAELKKRAETESITVRDIVETTYLPFFGFEHHPDFGSPAIKFLSRLIVENGEDIRPLAGIFTEPIAADTYALLAPILPGVSEKALKARIIFSLTNLINGVADAFSVNVTLIEQLGYEEPMDLMNHFFEYMVAGLSAPEGKRTREFDAVCAHQLELVLSTAGAKDLLESITANCGITAPGDGAESANGTKSIE